VKPPQETRFGTALIIVVGNAKGQTKSLFVPYSTETSRSTNLARLIAAFGDETDQWLKKKIDVTVSDSGKRTVSPVK